MGFEMLWFRYLISGLGALRSVFSLMMTVILLGIFLGALASGFLERRVGSPAKLYLIAQTLLIVSTLTPLIIFGATIFAPIDPLLLFQAAGASDFLNKVAAACVNLETIVVVVGIPALFMGFTFPLANAHIQRAQAQIGGRAGMLYLANTFGNVAGSLLTGFVLLPALGQQSSVTLLAACGIVGLVPLYLTVYKTKIKTEQIPVSVIYCCCVILGFAVITWTSLPSAHLLRNVTPQSDHKVLAISEGINENVVIVDEGKNGLRLFTNGHSMSSTGIYAQRYMRLFSHLPLLNSDNPKRALVICFGVGSTLHSVSLYPSIEKIEVADLSKNVLSHAHYFAASNRDVLKDPRVTVFVDDGRQHLRMQAPSSYDLITLEPPPIAYAGVAALYSKEFYLLAKSRLQDHGYMTQWLPAYQVPTDITLSIIRSFLDVFPNAVLLSGSRNELILMAAKTGPTQLNAEKMLRQINANSAVNDDLTSIAANSIIELAATFIAGPSVLARATENSPPVTDDNPLIEYSIASIFHKTRLPVSIFDASEINAWCPQCFDGEGALKDQNELPALMQALDTYYHTDNFLERMENLPSKQAKETIKYKAEPCNLDIVRRNFYFKNLFECNA